jgi:hypothetical protein
MGYGRYGNFCLIMFRLLQRVSGYSDLLMTAPPPAMRLPRRISDFVKRRIRKIAREPGDALIG